MKTFDDILGAKPINKWGLDFQLYWINVIFSKLASQSEAVFIPRQAFKTITEIRWRWITFSEAFTVSCEEKGVYI